MVTSNPPLSKDRPIWETAEFFRLKQCYQEAIKGHDFSNRGIFENGKLGATYSIPQTLRNLAACEEKIADFRKNKRRLGAEKTDALEQSRTARFTTLRKTVNSLDDVLAEVNTERAKLLDTTRELLEETQKPMLTLTDKTLLVQNSVALYELAQMSEKKYNHPALAALFYNRAAHALLRLAPEDDRQRVAALVEQMEGEPYIALSSFDAQFAYIQSAALTKSTRELQETRQRKATFNTITKQHERLNDTLKGFAEALRPQSLTGRMREKLEETLTEDITKHPLTYALRAASKALLTSAKDVLSGRETHTAIETLEKILYWPLHGKNPLREQVIKGMYDRAKFRGMPAQDLVSFDEKNLTGKIVEETKPSLRALYFRDFLERPSLTTTEEYLALAGLTGALFESGQKDEALNIFRGKLAQTFKQLRHEDKTYDNIYNCMAFINHTLQLPADMQREFYQKHGPGTTLPL